MKVIADIVSKANIPYQLLGKGDIPIESLTQKADDARQYSLFFAVRGIHVNGHDLIPEAIQNGCTCIVCDTIPAEAYPHVTFVRVDDSRQAMGYICQAFYDFPTHHLKLIGVTGTNGKSSVTNMLFHMFTNMGFTCGLIATTGYIVGNTFEESTHTTPDPIALAALFRQMKQHHCQYVFMEVSSIAIDQGRHHGLRFFGSVFTNITHDHLDYHGTFAQYIQAKKKWFDHLDEDAFALINADDKNASVMVQNSKAYVFKFSVKKPSDFKMAILEKDFDGMLVRMAEKDIWVRQVGVFNAYNLAAVYGVAFLCGINEEDTVIHISKLPNAPGRFDIMRSPHKVTGIVDYAHTPDALQNVLQTIHDIRTGNESVITIMGCGGDRDKEKRPIMGRIAAQWSDRLIITSDNPRNEVPEVIMKDIAAGVPPQHVKKLLEVTDRQQAIHIAVALAKPGDIILLAGKGHEKYQEIKGQKFPFDDHRMLYSALHSPSASSTDFTDVSH
jgi:UDP-N-acetylmuramoyl-L-alanyl-D-glutamate--2,6-diaminopimelate ligase